MNCTYHIQNQVQLICIAPHKCKCLRKLCIECQFEHGVDIQKYAVPINRFQEIVIKKLQEYRLQEKSEIAQQRKEFKCILSQTEIMLKRIWDELSQQINQLYDFIEQTNNSYLNLVNENDNIIESSYSDIEKLVQIIQGNTLNDWIFQKDQYLVQLEKAKNWWDQEVKAFSEKMNKEMNQNMPFITIQIVEKEDQVNVWKDDLYELLAQTKNIDQQLINMVIELLRKEQITDCIGYLSNSEIVKKLEHPRINNILLLINTLKNISEIDFNRKNYSTEDYSQIRKDLIEKIANDGRIIQFLKFLVDLTAIDERLIQCGSNSLNLLAEMKADVREQSFQNIRIRDTSLSGANMVRCNLNGSIFDNVDISGMSLNGASLFNCKWKNIQIHDLNKFDAHNGSVYTICFSPNGATFASGSGDNSIRLWDVKTGQQKAKLDGHTHYIYSIFFSPDGSTIVSGSEDKSIRLWDVQTGQQIRKLDGHTSAVYSVSFSPDGATLASGGGDSSIRLWDAKTGQLKAKLDGHTSTVYSVCFSPDGTSLASSSYDKSIRLWNIKTGQQKAILDGHKDYVKTVCFHPDGTILASGSHDKSIRLWDVKTGQQKAKLDGHSQLVISVCFSPDGTTLASGSYDRSIRLWDIKTGQQQAKLDGHTSYVQSVSFSPDGTTLASGSHDNSIRLWEIKIGQQQTKLDSNTNYVQSVCFSPDSTILASGTSNNTVSIWNVKTGQQIVPSDNNYKSILAQFQSPIFKNNILPERITSNITILRISQNPNLEIQGALILKGEFINSQGVDLRQLLKSKGCYILENQFGFQ
ncbi:unnamed protein product (macronuclear) [Paramecium tetraurelia]|uniref:Uncharacterized protein n=1 Tax=Paramecium tetraurelia TaxID=5888 RepID=A0CBM5_PARTE|nr:uncharacterized protein GSPATT00036975001 [Paramecium tetraurelia]CAK68192.1 unnamed protein product [Paramecium tetraurelia]|eukprot:XP_001435589.1 hypothetical protein (macronuclear) [Paramecium tetraurelia strain d4-2]